nr:formin-like protein 14 [Lolium perenne]
MSSRYDPTRTSKVELTSEGVASRVNYISNARLPNNWEWGMEPFSRQDPSAQNFPRQVVEDGNLEDKVWEADHVDPADRAAGEDENPEAAHQAVEEPGEPSSPPQPEEEEVVAAEPLRVVPLAAAPPTADTGVAIKFSKGAGAGTASGTVSPPPAPPRGRREPTPQPPAKERARTPPVFPLPSVGAGTSSSVPPPANSRSGSQDEPARRTSQPTIGDLLQCRRPEAPPTGAGGAVPGARAGSGPRVTPPPPPSSEPAREEPARAASADARALVKAKGLAVEPQGSSRPQVSMHVAPAASLANVVSASDSSLGSVGTMEKEWRDADGHEVTRREGKKGMASMEMFFSDFRAFISGSATEADSRLKRVEKVNKTVSDKWADLYNRLVASYHKAKTDRAEMARKLESAKASAAHVPELQEELRLARETARVLAAKAKETEGELSCLRRLEASHITELDSIKRVEQEKVDSLNRRLSEVDEKCQKLSSDMTAQSKVLSETSKRWVEEISALDRGMAATFPETQEEALAAVGRSREARRAAGEESSAHFSMEDHLASMHARITPMTMLGHELRLAAEDLYQLLWPYEALPGDLAALVKRLEGAPDRLLDWKDSAARAGADMALSFVLSWYEEVDLDQLESRRAGVEDNLSAEAKTRRLARAYAIADFIDKGTFVSDPDAPQEGPGEDEEMADAEEADPATDSQAPPAGPTPAGV